MKKVKVQKFDWKEAQLETFFYWINERHKIYLAKTANELFISSRGRQGISKPWPWSKDKILSEIKFTNPFRQLDRVTQEWTNRFIRVLYRGKDMTDGDLLFHCVMFRIFNWPETYDALRFHMTKQWDKKEAISILKKRRDDDFEKIFTGAYMVTPGDGDDKVETYCDVLDRLWDGRTPKQKEDGESCWRDYIATRMRRGKPSMERATNLLKQLPCVGAFVAYEIACDLRHTRLLHDAIDINSWANAGPGAERGIHRLLTGNFKWKKGSPRPDYVQAMRTLLSLAPKYLSKEVKACEWPFEMREIEHSLCEFDKYMRIKRKEGKTKGIFRPKMQLELL